MHKLLVCDDDRSILKYVSSILESAGYAAVVTQDPKQAVGLAVESKVSAALLDVQMPGVSGYDLLGRLRAAPAMGSLPVMFLSALDEPGDRVRGLRQGADDYLTKPFDPDELLLRVERLLGLHRASLRGTDSSISAEHQGAGAGEQGENSPPYGRYQVVEVLGEGAMGTIYRGWDPRLKRPVALKTVRLSHTLAVGKKRSLLERLHTEAVTVARCRHPNIVMVYDEGVGRKGAYFVTELVEGTNLEDLLRARGALPLAQAVPIAAALAAGLAAAHGEGIVHRDVKPANVLLGNDGSIKLADFGLAHVNSAVRADPAGIIGTPGYVPPEVFTGRAYAPAGDMFGLGVTFYEMLTGRQPLLGKDLGETIQRTLKVAIEPIPEQRTAALPGLADWVERLLVASPEQRPTANELRDWLDSQAAPRQWRWTTELVPVGQDSGA